MHDPSPESAEKAPSQLRYISTAKYGEDWHSVLHSHNCAELFYILSGSGSFHLENGCFPVGPGDLIFIDPLVRHTESGQPGCHLEYMVLGIENLELSDRPENAGHCRILHPDEIGEHIRVCLRELHLELLKKGPAFEEVCRYLTEVLVLRLRRLGDFSAELYDSGSASSKECSMVRHYIDTHFKESINLDQLAKIAHLNKYHLSHIFRRDYGVSPISYLLSLRIRESQRLLRSTDHSLAEISHFTGFSSPSYFSQSFRKAVGMSPAQYRIQSRQSSQTAVIHTEEESI